MPGEEGTAKGVDMSNADDRDTRRFKFSDEKSGVRLDENIMGGRKYDCFILSVHMHSDTSASRIPTCVSRQPSLPASYTLWGVMQAGQR